MTDCVLTHRRDPDRVRHAEYGHLICTSCYREVAETLARLPAMHAALGEQLAPRSGAGGPRVSGTAATVLPISAEVAGWRHEIATTLVSWVLLQAQESGTSLLPTSERPADTASWLAVRLDWAAAQLWIDEYADTLRQLRSRAWGLLAPSGTRRIAVVGQCPEDGCGGQLTAVVRSSDNLLPSELVCDRCETGWPASAWLKLGLRMHERLATLAGDSQLEAS